MSTADDPRLVSAVLCLFWMGMAIWAGLAGAEAWVTALWAWVSGLFLGVTLAWRAALGKEPR